jgi:hypothetical protein
VDASEFDEFKEKHKPKPVTIGDAFGELLGETTGNAPAAEMAEQEKAPESPTGQAEAGTQE